MKNLLVILYFFTFCSYSQSNTDIGWIPKINSSLKINENLKLINGIEVRETFYDEDFKFTHNLVDLSSVLSVKTSLNHSFNTGFVLRLSDKKPVYRFLQHYNIIQSMHNFKLAHRIGFEQFFSEVKPTYRTRYRLTLQKPLNGEKVDVNEYYFKLWK